MELQTITISTNPAKMPHPVLGITVMNNYEVLK